MIHWSGGRGIVLIFSILSIETDEIVLDFGRGGSL
jgi:hypothetical protein